MSDMTSAGDVHVKTVMNSERATSALMKSGQLYLMQASLGYFPLGASSSELTVLYCQPQIAGPMCQQSPWNTMYYGFMATGLSLTNRRFPQSPEIGACRPWAYISQAMCNACCNCLLPDRSLHTAR